MFPLKDRNPTHHVAFVTIALIVVNVLVFVGIQDRGTDRTGVTLPSGQEVGIESGAKFSLQYAAIPCELTEGHPLDVADVRELLRGAADSCDDVDGESLFAGKSVWLAVVTSMFLHADWFHLLFNMWFLWIFGNNIEDHVGPVKYLGFYLAAGVAATIAHVALQPDSSIPVIGPNRPGIFSSASALKLRRGRIVYERSRHLHLFDFATEPPRSTNCPDMNLPLYSPIAPSGVRYPGYGE